MIETARPIEVKFHVEPPLDREMEENSNALCYMTKIATMPIYDENF